MGLFKRIADAFRKPKPTRRRNYTAGKSSLITSSWTTTTMTADQVVRAYLRPLRARSREQVENNDYARRFISMIKTNVVGPKGIILQSKTNRSNGTADQPARDAIEAAWKDWGKGCDITESLSWVEMQCLFISTVAMDGEFFARKIRGSGKYGFLIQLIDPELIDVEYNKIIPDGFIRAGIEYDRLSRPAAYHLSVDNDPESYSFNGKRYVRIPANEIIHRYVVERVGQKRGIPWMATALLRMNMLNGYEDAAVIASRIGASKMGFYTSETGANYAGDDDGSGNLITEVEPGLFEQLPNGTKLETFDPTYPHEQYAAFVKACLRGISSGLGVSYNTLGNDLEGVSFSSIRAGVLEDREVFKGIQEWVIDKFNRVIFNEWMDMALLVGIPIGNNGAVLNQASRDRYKNVSWQPRRWPWVDPKKDIDASVVAIDRNICSTSSVIRELGGDPDDVFNEIAEERAKMKEMGITPEIVMNQMGAANDQDPQE